MKTILPLLLLLFFSCSQKESKPDYRIQVGAIQEAFVQKKVGALTPYLANGYTIKGIPGGFEPMLLPMVLQKLPAPEKYMITKETSEKKGTRLEVTFYMPGGKSMPADLLVAHDGKFLELNILNGAEITTE